MSECRIMVIGSSNTDMTVRSRVLPGPGETVLGGDFMMGYGGKGANQAVAAKRLGGNVDFVCKLGKDLFGDNAIRHYREMGLDTVHIFQSEKPSGVALIMVDDKAENSIVVASGANGDLDIEDIETLAPAIRRSSILLLQLEIPMKTAESAARTAYEAGVMVVLNPAPAAQLSEELMRCVSVLVPNESESSYISGVDVTDADSALEAVNVIKNKGAKDVIVTMGSKGSLVCDGKVTFIPARKVKAVDTTAAGDTFCGALCVALAEGFRLEEAARFATAASSISVQRPGAQDSVPSREEVDRIINKTQI